MYYDGIERIMPRELLTIRIEPALRARLRAAAERRQLTPSAVARLAIDAWLAKDATEAAGRPFEQLVDLLGCVAGPASPPSVPSIRRARTRATARKDARRGVGGQRRGRGAKR